MDTKTMRWLLSSGLVATGLTGCADPCSDDGLLQSEISECPADSGGGESDTDSDSATESDSNSETDSESDTLDTDSDGGSDCMDGMHNGDETDVDCGNSCGATCEDGEGCDDGADCISGVCNDDTLTCEPGDPVSYCEDADEDGFGDPDTCVDVPPGGDPPDGSVPNGDDCADDNGNAYPGAAEEEPDLCAEDEDGDGYGDADPPDGVDPGSDCVDTEADIYPGAAELEPELCTADVDDDGYGDDSATDIDPGADDGTDCADDNANAFPGAAPNDSPTACLEDEDGDDYGDADPPEGVDAGTDCNDMDDSVPFIVVGIPDDCPTAELLDGSLGCEFYAMPLANDAGAPPTYQLLLANAHPSNTASVTVETLIGGVWTPLVGPVDIVPEAQIIEDVPYNASGSTAISVGGAYRIVSDVPIAAYQASISQFTSDASLLIPVASWSTEYDVVGYDGVNAAFGEYVAVVAGEDATDVTIAPSQTIIGGGGVPAIAAGGSEVITLDEGDTVVLMGLGSNATSDASLTGTLISSTAPVGVFTGSECSNIPGGSPFCDHLEEMQTPTNTASTTVVAARMPPRGVVVEDAIWQIYAIEDAEVSFDALAGVTGLPPGPVSIAAGDSLELSVGGSVAEPGDFVAESDAPIIVSQFLAGSSTVGVVAPGLASGDPAHVIMPGASQLLEAYVVSTVAGNVANHLTVTRQAGSGDIDLDGAAIAAGDFVAISDDWEVARIQIAEGSHVLTSADAFAVVVSGYNEDNSYAYLGGGQARALICE